MDMFTGFKGAVSMRGPSVSAHWNQSSSSMSAHAPCTGSSSKMMISSAKMSWFSSWYAYAVVIVWSTASVSASITTNTRFVFWVSPASRPAGEYLALLNFSFLYWARILRMSWAPRCCCSSKLIPSSSGESTWML